MMKFEQGYIRNMAGKQQDIIVSTALTNDIKDLIIGGVFVMLGITHLTRSAFKKGALCFSDAEFKTMKNLGIID